MFCASLFECGKIFPRDGISIVIITQPLYLESIPALFRLRFLIRKSVQINDSPLEIERFNTVKE